MRSPSGNRQIKMQREGMDGVVHALLYKPLLQHPDNTRCYAHAAS